MKQVTLTIPDNWDDITIGMYQKYIKIQDSKGAEKNKVYKSLALLCNTTTAIVKKIPYKDLLEILGIVKKLVDSEPESTKLKKLFKLNNVEYGFCPNLNKLTAGEYIDLESYCKNPIENLHIINSILYRKVTKKVNDRYAIEPYNPDEFKEEVFKDCPMSIALSSLGFFLTLGQELAKTTLHYLHQVNMTQQRV